MDRRVLKTKKAIRDAFVKLLYEKDVDKITVKEIAEEADINRKTFYNYYSGVYQIIDEIENEVIDIMDKELKNYNVDDTLKNPYEIFDRITEILNSDIEFYGYLLGMRGNLSLVSKVAQLLKEKVKAAVKEQVEIDELKLDVAVDFIMSGMTAVYKQWFNSGMKEPLEEVTKIMGDLCINGAGLLLCDKTQ